MRNRSVTCFHCKHREVYPKTDMVVEFHGSEGQTPRYIHNECYEEYKEEQEFKMLEQIEKDKLNETIKDIHFFKEDEPIPKSIWYHIQDLRNGTDRYRRDKIIRFKEGVSYEVIRIAWELSRKKIRSVKKTKSFKKDRSRELKYCLTIVESRLYDAVKRVKKHEKEKDFYENPHQELNEPSVEPVKKFPKT